MGVLVEFCPKLVGFWRIQLLNAYYYGLEAKNTETIENFASDVHEDRLDRHLFNRGWLGVSFGILLACLVLGLWPGIAAALLHGVLYVFVAAPLINGLGHLRGRQNFTDNTAYNWASLSWVTGGESLHNNHHAFPKTPKFSVRRREFDPSWPVIRTLVAARQIAVVGKEIRLSEDKVGTKARR